MADGQNRLPTVRLSRSETEWLVIVLLCSLFLHLGVWGGYEAGKRLDLWKRLHWPALLALKKILPQPPVQKVDPVIFLEVTEPDIEPPKEAKYYSDNNSRAANPDADIESNQPKLNGKQRDVPKTQDAPKPIKANPTPPKPPQKPAEESKPAERNPANTLMPGGLEKAKPEDSAKPDENPAKPERPRKLSEVAAQKSSQLAGMQMQQDGGVRRKNFSSSLDALSTSFGSYDRKVIEAVSQRWYDLLDSQQFASDRTGRVTLTFRLNPDGSVTEMKIANNTVGDLLGYVCQAAIEQAAPFGQWPSDMKRKFGTFREITFTFYYY